MIFVARKLIHAHIISIFDFPLTWDERRDRKIFHTTPICCLLAVVIIVWGLSIVIRFFRVATPPYSLLAVIIVILCLFIATTPTCGLAAVVIVILCLSIAAAPPCGLAAVVIVILCLFVAAAPICGLLAVVVVILQFPGINTKLGAD